MRPYGMRLILWLALGLLPSLSLHAAMLRAGVASADITDRSIPVNDPCFAKVLLLEQEGRRVALITMDVVAIGGIGRIGDGFLEGLRRELAVNPGIEPERVLVNASHCHGVVRGDVQQLVVAAVRQAASSLVEVQAGSGNGREEGISENRRMWLQDGTQADMRRAYSMPWDQQVKATGPIDPQIGILRLDDLQGRPVAVVYHFACHPIMNPPSKGNSADYPGFASAAIEKATGATALFLQGCGGDINPRHYKEVSRPADAKPLGLQLAASVLGALRQIKTSPASWLRSQREIIEVPRAGDYDQRIAALKLEQQRLLKALRPTNINFKSFLPLLLSQRLFPDMPSHYAQGYMDQPQAFKGFDLDNRVQVEAYLKNLETMEQLTRLGSNLALLEKNRALTQQAASQALRAEVCALGVGDFKWVSFPGEVTVQVGLNIKKQFGDAHAHVSGYTNGYLYYTATREQRLNRGYAQEDCDVLVSPEWQAGFEAKALELLQRLK